MHISRGILFGFIAGILFGVLFALLFFLFTKQATIKTFFIYLIPSLIGSIIIFVFLGWIVEFFSNRYL